MHKKKKKKIGMFVVELVGNGVFHRSDSSNPDF